MSDEQQVISGLQGCHIGFNPSLYACDLSANGRNIEPGMYHTLIDRTRCEIRVHNNSCEICDVELKFDGEYYGSFRLKPHEIHTHNRTAVCPAGADVAVITMNVAFKKDQVVVKEIPYLFRCVREKYKCEIVHDGVSAASATIKDGAVISLLYTNNSSEKVYVSSTRGIFPGTSVDPCTSVMSPPHQFKLADGFEEQNNICFDFYEDSTEGGWKVAAMVTKLQVIP